MESYPWELVWDLFVSSNFKSLISDIYNPYRYYPLYLWEQQIFLYSPYSRYILLHMFFLLVLLLMDYYYLKHTKVQIMRLNFFPFLNHHHLYYGSRDGRCKLSFDLLSFIFYSFKTIRTKNHSSSYTTRIDQSTFCICAFEF